MTIHSINDSLQIIIRLFCLSSIFSEFLKFYNKFKSFLNGSIREELFYKNRFLPAPLPKKLLFAFYERLLFKCFLFFLFSFFLFY